jgi:hypothetical protein
MGMPKMPPVNFIRQLRMYEDGVPRRLRFWLFIFIAVCFQLSSGVYLAAMSQMVGETGILSEDVTMAGYCTLIGLNIIFPMMFRWKFNLYTRQLFFIAASVIIVCSILAMYVTTPVILWGICLLVGYFKMMGTFQCMSSIQLNITPTRNFAVFFAVIYAVVDGAIQISGIITTIVSYYTNWRMMNLVIITLMLVVIAIAYFLMKHDHRSGPYLPLKGVDWVGQLLWVAVCVVGAWLFTFGEHYEWWDSEEIWDATFLFLILLGITILHASRKEQPFISLHAFCYKQTWIVCFLAFAIAIMTAGAHVMQPTFVSGVLHYDSLNAISLNVPEYLGVSMGAILLYFVLVRWSWGLKRYLFLAFSMAIYYEMVMYFVCDSATDKETMYLALFALGIAEVMMEAFATYYLSQTIPFQHFFMNITIIGFVRCGLGSSAATAIVHRLFNWATTKQMMIVTENLTQNDFIDMAQGVNENVVTKLTTHGLLMAIKDCYGMLITVGLIVLIFIMLSRFSIPFSRFVPRIMAVRSWLTRKNMPDPTS